MDEAYIKERRRADSARAELASDIHELIRSGEDLLDRSGRILKIAVPLAVGMTAVTAVFVGIYAFKRGRRQRHRYAPLTLPLRPPQRSLFVELARNAGISFVSAMVARMANRLAATGLPDSHELASPAPGSTAKDEHQRTTSDSEPEVP